LGRNSTIPKRKTSASGSASDAETENDRGGADEKEDIQPPCCGKLHIETRRQRWKAAPSSAVCYAATAAAIRLGEPSHPRKIAVWMTDFWGENIKIPVVNREITVSA